MVMVDIQYMAGRWKPVAEALIEKYDLTNDSSVLGRWLWQGLSAIRNEAPSAHN